MHPGRLTVQDRSAYDPGRPGGHHLRMGPLVQHQQAHAPPRPPAPRRSRGRVPSAPRRAPAGPDTQVTRSASNPGRFIVIHQWGWTVVLNPDGTTTAWNTDKTKIIHSHSPPVRPG